MEMFRSENCRLLNSEDIENVLRLSTFSGTTENHKHVPNVVRSHLFETLIYKERFLIIVSEYDWGDYILHSVSDSLELYTYIKKE